MRLNRQVQANCMKLIVKMKARAFIEKMNALACPQGVVVVAGFVVLGVTGGRVWVEMAEALAGFVGLDAAGTGWAGVAVVAVAGAGLVLLVVAGVVAVLAEAAGAGVVAAGVELGAEGVTADAVGVAAAG
jgi:hypothetical protein